MHSGFPTWLSVTETQSSPLSFGPRGTTFRLGYGYTPLNSTAVTTYMSSTWTSNKNLMTAYKKNIQYWFDNKFLSTGPVRLRTWIWPSTGGFDSTACILWPIENMANLSPPDLWGFEHRFGYKLGIKSKSQNIIKARSLKATLLAIILIRDVFCVSLPEQDITRKGRVYEMYEMHKMYEMYENTMRRIRMLLLCYVQKRCYLQERAAEFDLCYHDSR